MPDHTIEQQLENLDYRLIVNWGREWLDLTNIIAYGKLDLFISYCQKY